MPIFLLFVSTGVLFDGAFSLQVSLVNLMTIIYVLNQQKRELVDILKKYPCIIYVKKWLEFEFQNFALK